MEIGHNIMHGQYDWMRDDEINSGYWGGITVGVEHWKHSHNEHHTWTNVIVRRDVGYGTLRMSEITVEAGVPTQPSAF
jgi:linoleoyl-CoA desaturase